MNNKLVIDLPKAKELLTAVVETNPNYVYEPPIAGGFSGDPGTCVYQYNGAPSCGVGIALYTAGVTLDELSRLDEGSVPASVLDEEDFNAVKVTQEAATLFRHFQFQQDNEVTWRDSLEEANRAV